MQPFRERPHPSPYSVRKQTYWRLNFNVCVYTLPLSFIPTNSEEVGNIFKIIKLQSGSQLSKSELLQNTLKVLLFPLLLAACHGRGQQIESVLVRSCCWEEQKSRGIGAQRTEEEVACVDTVSRTRTTGQRFKWIQTPAPAVRGLLPDREAWKVRSSWESTGHSF